MTYVCYQGNDHDCGFAALKMLLANKVHNKSYLYIKKPAKKKDYSFYDLIKIAKSYGFRLSSFQMPVEDVRSIPNGTIVMIKENHMVFLKKVGKRKVTYVDPNIGKVTCSLREFEKRWSGYVIECINASDAREIESGKIRMTPVWMDVIHYVIIGVIFISLMSGFYLINDNSSIILTMIFLLLFAVTELVENWYIIKELKYFDKQFLGIYFSRRFNQNFSKYRSYLDYKTKYFIVSKLLVSDMILITVFSILLCINDYRNVFVFLILLLAKMLDNKLFSKREREDVKSIERIESRAFEDSETAIKELSDANNKASRLALSSSLKKVVYLFICLCLALGMMLVTNVVSTNFIIFHFGIYFLMSAAFENIILFFSNFRDRQIKRARFLDECDL